MVTSLRSDPPFAQHQSHPTGGDRVIGSGEKHCQMRAPTGASTQAGAGQRRVLPCCRVSSVPITLCCLQKGGAEEGKGDFFLFHHRKDFQTL